ncbi:MAG TPA: hypothetical protein VJH89_03805 [Patescibacteria group bacterium]|nr:hypothetical protein [Patescibacteria group bacterium]
MFLPTTFQWETINTKKNDADFICPQAFGRNTHKDKNIGEIVGHTQSHFKDDIKTFKWLQNDWFDPGHPNTLLGSRALVLAKEYQKPIIGQWEVMYCMYHIDPAWYIEHQEHLIVIWPIPDDEGLSSFDVFVRAHNIGIKKRLRKPLLVAHPEHIQRCFFIAQHLFGFVVVDDEYKNITDNTPWFDKKSVQPWTRGPKRWLYYEILARMFYRFFGLDLM